MRPNRDRRLLHTSQDCVFRLGGLTLSTPGQAVPRGGRVAAVGRSLVELAIRRTLKASASGRPRKGAPARDGAAACSRLQARRAWTSTPRRRLGAGAFYAVA